MAEEEAVEAEGEEAAAEEAAAVEEAAAEEAAAVEEVHPVDNPPPRPQSQYQAHLTTEGD